MLVVRTCSTRSEIITLAVSAGSRRKGVASALLDHAIKEATRQRVKRLFLEVEDTNKAAIGFCKACGFGQTGRRKDYYRKSDGLFTDALVMARANLLKVASF